MPYTALIRRAEALVDAAADYTGETAGQLVDAGWRTCTGWIDRLGAEIALVWRLQQIGHDHLVLRSGELYLIYRRAAEADA